MYMEYTILSTCVRSGLSLYFIHMGTRAHPLAVDEIYHVYNRGNSKQVIFHDEDDYVYFQHLLYLMNTVTRMRSERIVDDIYETDRDEPLVAIGAYCLMPNHFHLLLLQKADEGVSKFMQKLATAYVMYYNKKYDHSGSLFEGKFKTRHANEDEYLKYLFAYFHMNPLKIGNTDWKKMLKSGKKAGEEILRAHPYSSFGYYAGDDVPENAIIDTDGFPKYYEHSSAFIDHIHSWMKYEPS